MEQKTRLYLTKKEFASFQNRFKKERDFLMLRVLYETGCTANELVHIQVKDLDLKRRKIHFPESNFNSTKKSKISLKLSVRLEAFIAERGADEYVFSSQQSKSITNKRVRQIFKSYSAKTKFGLILPQNVRYTHITHALAKGKDRKIIEKQLGIKSQRMTQLIKMLGGVAV